MLIVDMPMPKNCHECEAKCVSALYGRICGMTRKNIIPFLDKPNRPDWCPIKGEISEIELMHLEEERAFAARNIAAEKEDDEQIH